MSGFENELSDWNIFLQRWCYHLSRIRERRCFADGVLASLFTTMYRRYLILD